MSLLCVWLGSGLFDCGCFFFQAEDGIRGSPWSRGLGDVYKRQLHGPALDLLTTRLA